MRLPVFRVRPCLLGLLACLPLSIAHAQVGPRDTATTAPLQGAPVNVREQPLSSGRVTHAAQVQSAPGQAQVTVRSIQPDKVAGNYRINFEAMDVDGDGFISLEEAQANPSLADEFKALDTSRRGKLDREQLKGWLVQ